MRGTEFLLEKARIRHENRLSIENVPQHSGNNYINSLRTITLILYACMLIRFGGREKYRIGRQETKQGRSSSATVRIPCMRTVPLLFLH